MAHLIHSVLPVPPRKLIYVSPEDTIEKCMDLMAEFNIGALVVLNKEKHLMGIVSERDIVFSCLHKNRDIKTVSASEVLFSKVTVLSSHDTVEKAMQAMSETKRRHILICEKEKLLAILSIGDLLYHLLEDKAREIEHLEHYIYT